MKDLKAFFTGKGICYTPENDEDGTISYTHKDFYRLVKDYIIENNLANEPEDLATDLFYEVEWENPSTVLERWAMDLEEEDEEEKEEIEPTNKEKIRELVIDMLTELHQKAIQKVEKTLNSGAIDIDGWDEDNSPMLLPKAILTAILEDEARQYVIPNNHHLKRSWKEDVKNIKFFL